MLIKTNRVLNLYLCQSADWQCVVQAQDQESAATSALEIVMSNKDQNFGLSTTIVVKKLSNNLLEQNEDFEPLMLANAGFHLEAKNLHEILNKQISEIEDEH
jgi:hypothetical protein